MVYQEVTVVELGVSDGFFEMIFANDLGGGFMFLMHLPRQLGEDEEDEPIFDQYSSKGVRGFCRSVWHISQAEVGEDSQEHLWGVPRRFFF